jgi:hypothetical protein
MTTDGAVLRTRTRLVTLLTALVPLSLIAAFATIGTSAWRLIATIALLAASRECWSRARDEKKGRPFARGARIDSDRALLIGERARVARSDVQHASSSPGARLCVETNSGVEYKIEVASGEEARWLDALGARGLRKPHHVRFDSALSQLAFWTLGAPGIIIACVWVTREVFFPRGAEIGEAIPSMVLSMTLGLAASAFVSVRCMGRELRVGSDGMLVRDGLRSRFVSYAQLREVTLDERSALDLSLVDGTTQTVSLAGGADPLVLFERIVEARARAQLPSAAVAPQLLARRGRSLHEWRAALGQLLSTDGNYRAAGVDEDDFARVLCDETAPIEHRLAAALALGSTEATRHRVRAVAAALIDEPVRVAIASAASGSLDEARYQRAVERCTRATA